MGAEKPCAATDKLALRFWATNKPVISANQSSMAPHVRQAGHLDNLLVTLTVANCLVGRGLFELQSVPVKLNRELSVATISLVEDSVSTRVCFLLYIILRKPGHLPSISLNRQYLYLPVARPQQE